MLKSGITKGTPAKIPFGAGVYFEGVTFDEKVAPTKEEIHQHLVGATQEGGSTNITPTFFAPELDGALVDLAELQTKIGEEAIMETSFAELKPEYVKKAVIGNLNDSTDGDYDVITSSSTIEQGHFYDGFGFYGEHLDGRPMIVIFKKALCTSGFTMEPKNKTNSVFKGSFKCMGSVEDDVTKLPYAIFIRKEAGWTKVDPEEVEEQTA